MQLVQSLLQQRGDALRVGHRLRAAGDAEVEIVHVALHGDVEAHPVRGDRDGVEVRHLRAVAIEREGRAHRVGDAQVHDLRHDVGHAHAAEKLHQAGQQHRRAEQRVVRRGGLLRGGDDLLARARILGDARQPLERILDVRPDRAVHRKDLVVERRVAGLAQRDGHEGDQRLRRQGVVLREVTAQRTAAHGHDHVVHLRPDGGGRGRLRHRLRLRQRERARGVGTAPSHRDVEGRAGRDDVLR